MFPRAHCNGRGSVHTAYAAVSGPIRPERRRHRLHRRERLHFETLEPRIALDSHFGTAAQVIVPAGSVWQYLDDGSNQGTAWRVANFDDSLWRSGPAKLGYGDGDEATVVSFGPDSRNKHVTTYFRHEFTVDAAARYTDLMLHLRRDDGAVVYLNGQEIARSNMPQGEILFSTLASTAIGGSQERTFYAFPIDRLLLSDNGNVLAVEIHQASRMSSDIGFDLELRATRLVSPDTTPPAARLAAPLDNGPSDYDPRPGRAIVDAPPAALKIQLSDQGDGIDPGSVAPSAVNVTYNGAVWTAYAFSYSAASNRIVLAPAGGALADGEYVIRLNAGGGISDRAGNALPAETFVVRIDGGLAQHAFARQQGIGGYAGAVDAMIQQLGGRQGGPTVDHSRTVQLSVDDDDPGRTGGKSSALLRFDGLFGDQPGHIPNGAVIVSATLILQVVDPGSGMALHRMLQPWAGTDTWSTLGGISANDVQATAQPDGLVGRGTHARNVRTGPLSIDVTSGLQAWSDGAANFGWALLPLRGGGDGIDFLSSEASDAASRPLLTVRYVTLTPLPPADGPFEPQPQIDSQHLYWAHGAAEVDSIPFLQALHNMDAREFIRLLFDHNLHRTTDPDADAWLARVEREVVRGRAHLSVDQFKPEGILSALVLSPNAPLLIVGGNGSQGDGTGTAVQTLIQKHLLPLFEQNRSAILTPQTLQNIAGRDGLRIATVDPGRHYAITWSPPVLTQNDARLSPESGNLLHMGNTAQHMAWREANYGGVFGRQPYMQHPSTVKAYVDSMPPGHRSIFSAASMQRLALQRLVIRWTGDRPSGTFTLTFDDGKTRHTTRPIDVSLPARAAFADPVLGTAAAPQLLIRIRQELAALPNIPRNARGEAQVAVFFEEDSRLASDGSRYHEFHIFFFDPNKRGQVWAGENTPGFYYPETSWERTLEVQNPGTNTTVTVVAESAHYLSYHHSRRLGSMLDRDGNVILLPTGVNAVLPDYGFLTEQLVAYLRPWFGQLRNLGGALDFITVDHEAAVSLFDALYHPWMAQSNATNGLSAGGPQAAREYFKFLTTQPIFTSVYEPRLPAWFIEELRSGNVQGFLGEGYTAWMLRDLSRSAGHEHLGDHVGRVHLVAREFFPSISVTNWRTGFQSQSMIVIDRQNIPNARWLGDVAGTHQNFVYYTGHGPVAHADQHLSHLMPQEADATFWPNDEVRIKRLERDELGRVTVTVFSSAEAADNPQRGNNQTLHGFVPGRLVYMTCRITPTQAANRDKLAPFLFEARYDTRYPDDPWQPAPNSSNFFIPKREDPGPWTVLEVAQPDEDGDVLTLVFQSNIVGQPADTGELLVGPQSRFCALWSRDNWMRFLGSVRIARTMFLASDLPLAGWWGPKDPLWEYENGGRWSFYPHDDFREAALYHERLHNPGQPFFNMYNSNGSNIPIPAQDENDFTHALRVLDQLVPWKTIQPLSVNYAGISMQHSLYVLSGASLPDGTLLLRADWKPGDDTGVEVGLVEVRDNSVVVRLADASLVELPGRIPASADRTTHGTFLVVDAPQYNLSQNSGTLAFAAQPLEATASGAEPATFNGSIAGESVGWSDAAKLSISFATAGAADSQLAADAAFSQLAAPGDTARTASTAQYVDGNAAPRSETAESVAERGSTAALAGEHVDQALAKLPQADDSASALRLNVRHRARNARFLQVASSGEMADNNEFDLLAWLQIGVR